MKWHPDSTITIEIRTSTTSRWSEESGRYSQSSPIIPVGCIPSYLLTFGFSFMESPDVIPRNCVKKKPQINEFGFHYFR